MNQTTVTVPATVVEAVKFFDRNLTAIVGVLVVALLASITVEIVKHRYNKDKNDLEQLSKKAVAYLLTLSTTAFTALGYALFLLQSNQSYVSQLPYIGQGVTEALGVGYLLYNLRLNKTYKSVSAALSTWSANRQAKATAQSLSQPVEPAPAPPDQLV